MDKLVGGWQASGIFQGRTGLPFTVTAGGDLANTGIGISRANLVSGRSVALSSDRTLQRWFNTAAFVVPDVYTYGDAGRNIVDAP